MIPEAPEDVREAARFAFWEVQMLRDDARAVARARERIRNIQSPRGIAGLKIEHGGGLWEGREMFETDFASLSFEDKKRRFMSDLPDAVASWGAVAGRPGRRDHAPYHAAGVPLLAWWKGQGREVTAYLGRGGTRAGNRGQQPCATVRFLANEFLDIARWYANSEWAAEAEGYENPQASDLLPLVKATALNIGFDVAERHNQNRTAKR